MEGSLIFQANNKKFYCHQCKAYDITVVKGVCFFCLSGFYPTHEYSLFGEEEKESEEENRES